MDPVQLIAFPVQLVSDPFRVHRAGETYYPFRLPRCPTDWSSRDPAVLSQSLQCQVRNNYADFDQLSGMCQEPSYREQLWTGIYDEPTKKVSVLQNYYVSQEQKEEECQKFLQRLKGYQDTLSRDQDVFNQKDWDVRTYAIVLLYKGEYFGHIYAWLSPSKPPRCFAMGIRGRVDSVFREDQLQNVSAYLFEGVRKFALAKGCQAMTVTKPLRIMEAILKRMGFERKTVVGETIGRSLAFPRNSEDEICYSCYSHDLIRPFTGETSVTFDLV